MEMSFDLDPEILTCSLCTIENIEIVKGQVEEWYEIQFGEDRTKWPYEMGTTLDVPVRTIGSQEQTHWFCLNTFGSSYFRGAWDYYNSVPQNYIIELSLYTDFLVKHNIEIMNQDKHAKYLNVEKNFVDNWQSKRDAYAENKVRDNIDKLRKLGY